MRGIIVVDHAGLLALTDTWELGGEIIAEPKPFVARRARLNTMPAVRRGRMHTTAWRAAGIRSNCHILTRKRPGQSPGPLSLRAVCVAIACYVVRYGSSDRRNGYTSIIA